MKLEARFEELDALATEFAESDAMRRYLEDFKYSKKALLMKDAEIAGHKSIAAQEREAMASQEYQELLVGLRVATEKAEKSRWLLKNAHLKAEIFRTLQANERVKMGLL